LAGKNIAKKLADLLTDLFKAYYSARSNKRNTYNALKFELHYEHNLIELYDEIINLCYEPRPSICFIVNKPVKREVFAADFRDRVIHHLIFNYISPVFEKRFINDSYSCRKGKGTHYGIQRVNHFIRSCSDNYHKDCYILKMDIQGYFMSIERSLLYEMVSRVIIKNSGKITGDNNYCNAASRCATTLYLIRKTIFNDPVKGCIVKSKMSEWKGLPSSKSLFYAGKNQGLPIGNLTSQLFANIYLDEFDHFMKQQLKLKYYGRYVDDIVVVHPDQYYLKMVIPAVREYLKTKLMLQLHPRKIYLQHYTKGVVFLGASIKPYRIYIANRTKGNFYSAIQKQNEIARHHKPSKEERGKFLTSMNSYLGIMKHYKTHKLRKGMLFKNLSVWWWNYVCLKGGIAKFALKVF
jgi:hypothetical protein